MKAAITRKKETYKFYAKCFGAEIQDPEEPSSAEDLIAQIKQSGIPFEIKSPR